MIRKEITCKDCGAKVVENIDIYNNYPYECPICKKGKYSCEVNK